MIQYLMRPSYAPYQHTAAMEGAVAACIQPNVLIVGLKRVVGPQHLTAEELENETGSSPSLPIYIQPPLRSLLWVFENVGQEFQNVLCSITIAIADDLLDVIYDWLHELCNHPVVYNIQCGCQRRPP